MLNIQNRTIFHNDNIHVLRGMNSDCVDLIYLDPPFNKNDTFVNSDNRRVQEIKEFFMDKQKAGQFEGIDFDQVFQDDSAAFSDIWSQNDLNEEYYKQIDNYDSRIIAYIDSIKDSCPPGGFYYLIYMTVRLIELKRILKNDGVLYLHCDPTFSHYLKAILDFMFGADNFRNEIVWNYRRWPAKHPDFQRMHDIILRYTKGGEHAWNQLYEPLSESTVKAFGGKQQVAIFDESGHRRPGLTELESQGAPMRDVWDIGVIAPISKERCGYPTQKPLALLERIIESSTAPSDVVLDPFCGCATTCLAAENLNRQWVGIDKNPQTYYMIYYRAWQSGLLGTEDKPSLLANNLIQTEEPPTRDDISAEERKRLDKEAAEIAAAVELSEHKRAATKLSPKEREAAKDFLYGHQAGICSGCDMYMPSANLTLDHIVPQSCGGDDGLDNLQLMCHRDNIFKSNRPMLELFDRLLEYQLISQSTYEKQVKHWREYEKLDTKQSGRYRKFCQDQGTGQGTLT